MLYLPGEQISKIGLGRRLAAGKEAFGCKKLNMEGRLGSLLGLPLIGDLGEFRHHCDFLLNFHMI